MAEPHSSRSEASIFVGRQRDMETLTAAIDDAMADHGRLVMLTGEPGIGKIRTAQELAALAAAKGACVLWGRRFEEEGKPDY